VYTGSDTRSDGDERCDTSDGDRGCDKSDGDEDVIRVMVMKM
jgi:hypothetical protein